MSSNFNLLPPEIKIHIFKYLDGPSKLRASNVSTDFRKISTDRTVVQHLDFSERDYYNKPFDNLKQLTVEPYVELVTNLNLNGVFWIQSNVLRSTIKKLVNLQALYVAYTQLTFRDLIFLLNDKNLNKLKRLALSLQSDSGGDVFRNRITNTKNIRDLYVTYNSRAAFPLVQLLKQFTELDELWMIDPYLPYKVNNNGLHFTRSWLGFVQDEDSLPKIKKRIVLSQHISSCLLGYEDFIEAIKANDGNWLDVFQETNLEFNFLVFENKNLKNRNYDVEEISDKKLYIEECVAHVKNNYRNYCSISDLQNLCLQNNSNENIKYRALNFIRKEYTNINLNFVRKEYTNINLDKTKFETFLFSSNTDSIRTFRCDPSPFLENAVTDKNKSDGRLFKKRRLNTVEIVSSETAEQECDFNDDDDDNNNNNSRFARFTRHTPNVDNVHLFEAWEWQPNSLFSLKNWKLLKTLTIESSHYFSGKFLIEVMKECVHLVTLKISEVLTLDLCAALKHAQNLRDLRYERKTSSIQLDTLFETLTAACPSLQRLYIHCRFAGKISRAPIEKFMCNSKELRFLFVFVQELSNKYCQQIKQIMSSCTKHLSNPVIQVHDHSTFNLDNFMYKDVPAVHLREVCYLSDNVKAEFLQTFF